MGNPIGKRMRFAASLSKDELLGLAERHPNVMGVATDDDVFVFNGRVIGLSNAQKEQILEALSTAKTAKERASLAQGDVASVNAKAEAVINAIGRFRSFGMMSKTDIDTTAHNSKNIKDYAVMAFIGTDNTRFVFINCGVDNNTIYQFRFYRNELQYRIAHPRTDGETCAVDDYYNGQQGFKPYVGDLEFSNGVMTINVAGTPKTITIPIATESSAGLMSPEDKTKLSDLETRLSTLENNN